MCVVLNSRSCSSVKSSISSYAMQRTAVINFVIIFIIFIKKNIWLWNAIHLGIAFRCFFVRLLQRCWINHIRINKLLKMSKMWSLDEQSPLCIQFQVIIIIIIIMIIIIIIIISRTQPDYYLLVKWSGWKTIICFGLYFLRPSSGRKYTFLRKTVQWI